jgi:hypothetical protein
LGAVEKAAAEAEKHGDRSELLTALVAEAKGLIEQARAEQTERARAAAEVAEAAAAVKAAAAAERARVAAEEAEAAAAVKVAAEAAAAAERLQSEEEVAALTLRLQEAQQRLGNSVAQPAAPTSHPDAEETMCVVCFDAPKDHLIVPCGHQCVCARCAEQLTKTRTPMCPVCRGPIQQTVKVFCS